MPHILLWPEFTQPGYSSAKEMCRGNEKLLMGKFLKGNILKRKWAGGEKISQDCKRLPWVHTLWEFGTLPIFTTFVVTISSEFIVTPKIWLLLQIRSFWAKPSEFTLKFAAPRLGHHFYYLKGWKILSRSWDMTNEDVGKKTLSSGPILVGKYRSII